MDSPAWHANDKVGAFIEARPEVDGETFEPDFQRTFAILEPHYRYKVHWIRRIFIRVMARKF